MVKMFINAPKEVQENEEYNKLMELSVKFGVGNLMPIFSNGNESVRMVISKNKVYGKVGEIIPKEEGYQLAKESKPLVSFEFPKSVVGLESIEALKSWLDLIKLLISEEDPQ